MNWKPTGNEVVYWCCPLLRDRDTSLRYIDFYIVQAVQEFVPGLVSGQPEPFQGFVVDHRTGEVAVWARYDQDDDDPGFPQEFSDGGYEKVMWFHEDEEWVFDVN